MIGLVLAEHAFPGRRHFAPIDAAMLGKYALFERLGFFGVEPGSARGAAQLLRTGGVILRDPASAVWITAQGGFADVRQRPVRLQGGAARLAQRCPDAAVLPLAVEYAFWQEKRPEALVAFGEPIDGRALAHDTPGGATHRVGAALTAVMDRLAVAVIKRDPSRFETVLAGRSGIGGVYDAWRRTVAWARGRRFDSRHENGAER